MKKVKLSLAALVLIVAIAGTATANANADVVEPCSKIDPKLQVCIDGSDQPCCEDETGIRFYP